MISLYIFVQRTNLVILLGENWDVVSFPFVFQYCYETEIGCGLFRLDFWVGEWWWELLVVSRSKVCSWRDIGFCTVCS